MKVDLTDLDLKEALSVSILAALSGDAKEKLLKEALSSLMGRDNYGSDTVIQKIFKSAVTDYAQELVKELLVNDVEFQGQLKTLVSGVIASITTPEKMELMSKKMTVAFLESMWR